MSSLDDLVRETLAARAHDVDGLALATTPPPRRTGRRWVAVGTVVVVAAAILVAVVLVAPWRGATDRNAAPPAVPTPPAGMQWVSYHGITLTVPDSWATGIFSCTQPDRSAVQVAQWSAPSCAAQTHPVVTPAGATVMYLGDLSFSVPMGDPTTIAGQPARRFVNVAGPTTGTAFTRVQLLTPGVEITVAGPVGPADEILAGLRYTPVDALGCTAAITADPIPPNQPAGRITLPTPTTVTGCDYAPTRGGAGWLMGSRVLTADERTALVAAVNAAPPWTPPPEDDGQLEADSLAYRFTLADGSTRTVSAQAFGSVMAASDGDRRVALPYDAPVPGAWS